MQTKQEYTEKVHDFLKKMKITEEGEVIDFLPNKIMPSKMAKAFFVDIVKNFIDRDIFREHGFCVEFNSAMEKIRKVAYWGKSTETPPQDTSSPEGAVLKPGTKIQEVEHA